MVAKSTFFCLVGGLLLAVVVADSVGLSVPKSTEYVDSFGGITNPEPIEEVQDRSIEINRTRFNLVNFSVYRIPDNPNNYKVRGGMQPYPDRQSLFHPYLWTYIIQVVCGAIAAVMGVYVPLPLLVLLLAAVSAWPLSWFCNLPIYAMHPGDFMWTMMALKSIIVNIAPTVPVLLICIFKFDKRGCTIAGYWTYAMLWANVAWTLGFPMPDLVMKVNGVCGASLCLSLAVRLISMACSRTVPAELRDGIVYSFGTSLSWLVCYTVWNALFVADFAVCLVLQDILFWCFMFYYWYHSNCASNIEHYFGMARPIQLSIYIAVSDWTGLIPFFRDAAGIGLDVNRHAFFLFIASVNALYSMGVLAREVYLAIHHSHSKGDLFHCLHEEHSSSAEEE